MEIHPSARKHGIPDEDIRHAVKHYMYVAAIDSDGPPWRVLYLGPNRAGNLLEVVTVDRDDDGELVIHAMKKRRHLRFLLPKKGER